MKPTYDFIVQYDVSGICLTPLRIGNADGNISEVMRNRQGTPIIPGSSVIGALREWKDDNDLFGPRNSDQSVKEHREGHIRTSDAVFEDHTDMTVRPRVRIDPKTASAADGGKFSTAQLPADSRFSLQLWWIGCTDRSEALQKATIDTMEQYLAALHAGEITLGGQKSNGYGRVRLENVKRRCYDLYHEPDLQAWIRRDNEDAENISGTLNAERITSSFVRMEITAKTEALLVKAPAGEGVGEEGTDAVQYSEGGKYIIPGSSIKGAIRAYCGRLQAYLGVEEQELLDAFGYGATTDQAGKPGTIFFEDAVIAPKDVSTASEKRTRIRIDRVSGGVIRGGLFSEKPVGGTIRFAVRTTNSPTVCRMLLFALRDLGMGLYTLGSEASVGYGKLYGMKVRIYAPKGEATMTVSGDGADIEDPNGILEKWTAQGGTR